MSEIKVDTLNGKTSAGDITVTVGASATQSLSDGIAKSWCSTDGDSTVNNSHNISSTTDNADGDNTFTFTNNVSAANYVVFGMSKSADSGGARMAAMNFSANAGNWIETSGYRLNMHYDNTNRRECSYISTGIHGDLA